MKRITIDIDENYLGIMTLTLVGFNQLARQVYVTTSSIDVEKYDKVSCDDNGSIKADKWGCENVDD